MDPIRELLARLASKEITSFETDELVALQTDLAAAVREARNGDLTADVIAAMQEGAAGVASIQAEITQRNVEADAIIADADATLAELDATLAAEGEGDEAGDGEAEPETAVEGDEGDEAAPEAEGDGEAVEPEAEGAEPIAASGTPITTRPRPTRPVRVPARHQPQASAPDAGGPSIIASGETPGVAPGHRFDDFRGATEALFAKADAVRGGGNDGERHYVVREEWGAMYDPSLRVTGRQSPEEVGAILTRAAEGHAARMIGEPVTASGGVPGPPEPRYDQITYGQTNRPIRDALPGVPIPRGTIIYNISPTLADIVLDSGSAGTVAIGSVSASQDLAGATKVYQDVSAPTTNTVTVEANTLRFQHGNFADRFNPERLAAFQRLGQVAYARHNDARRLADIKTGSTLFTDTPATYGAFRDMKRQVEAVVAQFRDELRDYAVPLTAIFPAFLPSMLVADVTAQQPGDSTLEWTVDRMKAEIASWGVNPVWAVDSIRGSLLTIPTANGRSAGYDADVEWCCFPAGTWVFGDGGQLDLGIVRDSVLNATNKFQTFFESWECVFKLAPYSRWFTSSLCAGGGSQVASSISKCSPQGS